METTLKRGIEFFIVQHERDQLMREKLSVLHNMMITDRVVSLGVMAAGLMLTLAQFPEGVSPDQAPDSALVTLGWWFMPAVTIMRILMVLAILPYAVSRESHEENLRKLGGGDFD